MAIQRTCAVPQVKNEVKNAFARKEPKCENVHCLVVIDMERCTETHERMVYLGKGGFGKGVRKLSSVISAAAEAGVPTVLVRYMPDSRYTPIMQVWEAAGSEAITLRKPGWSAFSSQEFKNFLHEIHAGTLILAGYHMVQCVYSTLTDARSYFFGRYRVITSPELLFADENGAAMAPEYLKKYKKEGAAILGTSRDVKEYLSTLKH